METDEVGKEEGEYNVHLECLTLLGYYLSGVIVLALI